MAGAVNDFPWFMLAGPAFILMLGLCFLLPGIWNSLGRIADALDRAFPKEPER